MSKRKWVLFGVGGLIVAGMMLPVAAGGTSGAPSRGPAANNGYSASLRSSHVPIRCAPGAQYGSVSVPVGIKTPPSAAQQKGTNALVSWTVDRTSAGSDQRFVSYNSRTKLTNSRVPCTSPRPRLVCRLVFKRHPPRLHLVCHHVKPAS
jgi:hypothetical protein